MEEKIYLTKTAKETEDLGRELVVNLNPGDVVLLNGALGSGKTTFTKGLADGLGIKSRVLSPTYILVRQYTGDKYNLNHIDLYRLNDEEEISNIGIDEILSDKKSITVIEWAKKSKKLKANWEVSFSVEGEGRKIIIRHE